MNKQKLYLSNSSIQLFLNCKRRFKYRYIDKVTTDKVSSKYLSFGQSIHSALAQYNMITDQTYKTLEVLQKLLKRNWVREGYISIDEERKYADKGLKMLATYFEKPLDISKKNLIIEEMVKKDMDDGFVLCGKIDKAYINEDGCIEVVDYKTAENIERFEDYPVNIQLPIYMLLVKFKTGYLPQSVSNYYLSQNRKITKNIDPQDAEMFIEYLKNISGEIQNEKKFACSPTPYCRTSCEYANTCEGPKDYNASIINSLKGTFENAAIKSVFSSN